MSRIDNYYSKYLKYKIKYKLLCDKLNVMKGGGSDNTKISIILFKASWCGHCKNFLPTWNKLIGLFEENNIIKFTTYDVDEQPDKIKEWGINGFPTIMIEKDNQSETYNGGRDLESLQRKLNDLIASVENDDV